MNDHFDWLLSKKKYIYILLLFQGYPRTPTLLRKDANLLLHCTFSFRLNDQESNAETTNV